MQYFYTDQASARVYWNADTITLTCTLITKHNMNECETARVIIFLLIQIN